MKLELSNGSIIENPTHSDLENWIRKIGTEIDHLILIDGDDFIQTAGEQDSLVIQRQEAGDLDDTEDTFDTETVIQTFQEYLDGDTGGKSPAVSTSKGESESFADEIADTLKKEASKAVGRFFRKLF